MAAEIVTRITALQNMFMASEIRFLASVACPNSNDTAPAFSNINAVESPSLAKYLTMINNRPPLSGC